MKKIFLLFTVLVGLGAAAQTTETKKKDWSKIDLSGRPKDHFMIQYGADSWTGRPDSVRTGNGFSRHFNFYVMFDKPFKNNKRMSLAYGAGIGSSNIFFDNVNVDIKSTAARLPFTIADSLNHFNKSKLTNIFLDIPVELRYYSNPENPAKSWKFAIGAKIGTLLRTHTKGKNLVDKNGQTVYGNSFVQKEVAKKYFNGTAIAITGRVGYGIIGLQGSYQITSVLKEGVGPSMNRFTLGISISGL
ncbi:outer membrane beta-barrel protein [Sediminibacterium sp.]|uniref:outer membrane beta-barrel protein n=1 Tax=Sediminibacterium sp. TaxID=1917865 RepID=UPI002732A8FD|nr:outer membrane beta-barrel protein [Sediminibacterium sp.]MDP3394723.1 outer membrane beta-barrel protein [Sediminibacterium sp.]MDP3568558.1 outer membrane beta-barrel protein [Sediminibacterium sp.]